MTTKHTVSILCLTVLFGYCCELKSQHNQDQLTFGRTIEFSGIKWYVKTGFYGPGPNYWSDSEQSVWLDAQGRLHLKIRKLNNKWHCAEIYSVDFTTYGEHRFLIEGDVTKFDQNVVLGLFTYSNTAQEIDIEFSKWGDQNFTNIGSFAVQPWTVQGNTERFPVRLDSIRTTHLFNWQEDCLYFNSSQGHYDRLMPAPDYFIHQWVYWGSYIPKSSDRLRTHINFWLVNGKSPIDTSNLEIIVSKVNQPLSADVDGKTQQSRQPIRFELDQNFPNPFATFTTIPYRIQSADFIQIHVFDVTGRKIASLVNENQSPNEYITIFNAKNLAAGVYFYQLQGKQFSQVRKMVYIP